MEKIIEQIAHCIEFGKIDKNSPFPPDMKGQDGADELVKSALDSGIKPSEILSDGMIAAMEKVGNKFTQNKIFVPQMLMSAKAMSKAMLHIKPYFQDGSVQQKGTFVIGTVSGDLHDIGKNLVSMMVEGNGWNVVDLGVDVSAESFIETIKQYPGCFVGLSALLTTTMVSMEKIVGEIKAASPDTKIIIGGAPVNQEFCEKISADAYSPDPQGAVSSLNKLLAA
ncbi:MAG: cobalamin-binding protein [Bacteroidetes bacterium]|jgi:methanogenic corrinoid protein MtbC1|nr:cobalamin-binding protein [Bacteroidota bacterium]